MSGSSVDFYTAWNARAASLCVPLSVSMELTNRCNERCSHCYIDDFRDDPSRVLSLHQWLLVLDKLRAAGTLFLNLMGGEAMLNPNFWDIVSAAADRSMHISMITNGLLIRRPEIARELHRRGVAAIAFSVYSLDAGIHDSMTGVPGSSRRLMQAIEYCDCAGIEIKINSLLTVASADRIFDLVDWCEERGYRHSIDANVTPTLAGNLEPTRQRATSGQLYAYYRELARRAGGRALVPPSPAGGDFVCNAAKGRCAVTAYGEVLPCIEIRKPLGNLIHDDFHQIWESDEARRWRNIRHGDLAGSECNSSLCDHCPGMADHEHGNPLKVVAFTAQLARIRREVFYSDEESAT